MRVLFFYSALFFCSLFTVAQNVDSLKEKLIHTNSIKEKSEITLELGIINYKIGDYILADNYLTQSIENALKINDDKILIKAYNNKGNIFADKIENTKALINYQLALKLAEKVKDFKYIAHINKNIGALFVSLKRFDESLKYYYSAENAALKFNDSLLYADCNNNIGTVFEQQNKLDDAIDRYNKALKIYEKYNVLDGVSMAYSNLAIVTKLKKNYNLAIDYNLKSLKISEQLNDQWSQAATLNNIGNLYGELGNYDLAKKYCYESLNLSEKIKANEITTAVFESIANAAFKSKDYKTAYSFQKKFTLSKDSFVNSENHKQLSELTIKYETEKKEKENQQLKFENELKNTEVRQATTQRNWIIFICIAVFVIIMLFFILIKRSQDVKNKLQQQELINQTAFDTEQVERNRIASDLHDGVGQKLSVVKMQLSLKTNDAINSANKLLDEAINEVRTATHNLYPNDLNKGLFIAVEELVEQINYTSLTVKIKLQMSDFVRQQMISKQTELYIYRVIQEIVNNALKYSNATSIGIDISLEKNTLMLSLSDNGKGFDINGINEFKGIGLKNIFKRINQLKGKVVVNSKINEGTNYQISIPL